MKVLLMVLCFLHSSTAEIYDLTTIYRLKEPPLILSNDVASNSALNTSDYESKIVEFHARTNARGLPFILPSGEVLEANVGFSKTFPNLGPTNWVPHNWVKLKANDKFGVLTTMLTTNGDARSYSGSLTIELKVVSCQLVYSTGPQTIQSQRETVYTPNVHRTCHLKTDVDRQIKLEYNAFQLESHDTCAFDSLAVFSGPPSAGNHLRTNCGSVRPISLVSPGNELYLVFKTDSSNQYRGFSLSYSAVGGNPFGEDFSLKAHDGSLTSPTFVPHVGRLCIDVVFKMNEVNGMNLILSAETETSSISLGHFDSAQIHQVQEWTTHRFQQDLLPDVQQKSMKIVLNATKTSSSSILLVKHIMSCNTKDAEEDILVVRNPILVQSYKNQELNNSLFDATLRCFNGGKPHGDTEMCICPAGFTGTMCQVGCGENRFGADCGGVCSSFKNGCEGLIMCKFGLGCNCAPGFTGPFCNSNCEEGHYGAGCQQVCGACKADSLLKLSCDRYSGTCVKGCQHGFYPPLCRTQYKSLVNAPVVQVINPHELHISFDLLPTNLKGQGNARFYQIQYQEVTPLLLTSPAEGISGPCLSCGPPSTWIKLAPQLILSTSGTFNITQLNPGTRYKVRVVLIDADGNSYQLRDVPSMEIETSCILPEIMEYNLTTRSITEEGFIVSWQYLTNTDNACPLKTFEVYLSSGWRWLLVYRGLGMQAELSDLWSGTDHRVKIRAVTMQGPAAFSDITVRTTDQVPGAVVDLRVIAARSSELEIGWSAPRSTGGTIRHYVIHYKCEEFLSCPKESCLHSEGELLSPSTSAVLRELLPHAQYFINVAAVASSQGPFTYVIAATDHSAPQIAPDVEHPGVFDRTNNSFSVHWKKPDNCSGLNGYLYHYHYELRSQLSTDVSTAFATVQNGVTDDTSMGFYDLNPFTKYTVSIFLVTSGGWNRAYPLVMQAVTRATMPDAVDDLEVYKRGRKMLGVRWAVPEDLHGSLDAFIVTCRLGELELARDEVTPRPCPAWPHLFCYTLGHLTQDTEYSIQVQIKISEVLESGEVASVTGITREAAPGPPTNLKIVNQTDSGLTFQWGLPYFVNGLLRSFLVTVEETDSYNQTDCCQDFPIQTLHVHTEKMEYVLEFTGLKSASTYTISVSGKTVAMGPGVSISASTRPPVPVLTNKPQIIKTDLLGSQGKLYQPVKLFPSTTYEGLVAGYLLVVLPGPDASSIPQKHTWDKQLTESLKKILNQPFYVAAEFQQAELEDMPEVQVGTGQTGVDGKFGQLHDPELRPATKYRVALVLILEYCGLQSLGYSESEEFIVSN